MAKKRIKQPEKIKLAIKLLYISLWIGVGFGILVGLVGVSQQLGIALFSPLIFSGIMWLHIHMINKGRNWARIAFLILLILGLPFGIPLLLWNMSEDPVTSLVGLGQVIIQLIVLVLLFQKPSSAWFKAMKGNK